MEKETKQSNFSVYAFVLLVAAIFGNLYQWSTNSRLKHEVFMSNLDYNKMKKTNDILKQESLLKEKVLRDMGIRVSGNLGGDRWAECAYFSCKNFQKTHYLYNNRDQTWVVIQK